jgi:hypothetical protein
MGTKGRWRAWLAGLVLIVGTFALAWWNNPVNVGGVNESQRAWLALGYSLIGLLILGGPLVTRPAHEVVAQRTLIIILAIIISLCVWWVGYLPSDPGGCSRVNAPDCHTNAVTRWRALGEGAGVYLLSFMLVHTLGAMIGKRRSREAVAQPAR